MIKERLFVISPLNHAFILVAIVTLIENNTGAESIITQPTVIKMRFKLYPNVYLYFCLNFVSP